MTDLLQVLPDFDTRPYSHLLPSLDKALITTNDLITLEPTHVAKRAQLPAGDLRKLVDALVLTLHRHLGFGAEEAGGSTFLSGSGHASTAQSRWGSISVLDEKLDAALDGGIRCGYLTEVTGERFVDIALLPTSC
jgi:DNA repair protein RAD57